MAQFPTAEGMVNLGIGQPQLRLLPREELLRSAQIRLTSEENSLLNYGPGAGAPSYLEALAGYLSRGYQCPMSPDSLVTTNGASAALDLICGVFCQPEDTILVEEPSYFLALQIFADHKLNIVGVPLHSGQVDPDEFERLVIEHQPKLFYTIPVFQNPTGQSMPDETKSKLLELSNKHDFLIVADEVYQTLTYSEIPPLPFAARLQEGHVLSVGSFSKTLAPGLRVGWIQARPELRKQLLKRAVLRSGGCLNQFTSCLLEPILNDGSAEHYLSELKATYSERVDLMAKLLKDQLPSEITFTKPGGGFFFWLKWPDRIDTNSLLEKATQLNVGYQPGERFGSSQSLSCCMRLSFAYYGSKDLSLGIQRLALLAKDAL